MILQEFKLFKPELHKIIIFTLISVLIFFGINNFMHKDINENLTIKIGIINNDNDEQLQFFLNILSKTKIGENFEILTLNEIEAKQKLLNNEISAYVFISNGFIDSIYTGENLPLKIVGNENNWLDITIIKLGMNVAISYLTTAQAGVYAIVDTANDLGLNNNEVEKILMPINIAYGSLLLNYENHFEKIYSNATNDMDVTQYYIKSIIFFLAMVSVSIIITTLQESMTKEILNKYITSGISLSKILINKFLVVSIIIFTYTLPVLYFFGVFGILIVLLITSVLFFLSLIFSKHFALINILFLSFFTLFISGGAIPLVFLPDIFKILAKLTPNYWVLNFNNGLVFIFGTCIYIIALNITSYCILSRRVKS